MGPSNIKNAILMFKITSLLLLCSYSIAKASATHIEAVSCSQRADCLAVVNEEIVATIHSHMHNETDACENFWDYACGEWTAAPYYDHVDTFGAIGNFYRQQLSDYLSAKEPMEDRMLKMLPLLNKLLNYYAACRATGGYFLHMAKYLQERPTFSNADWPTDLTDVLMQQREIKEFNWLNTIAELRRYGLNDVLLSEDIGFAANNSTHYVVELKMPDKTDAFQSKKELLQLFEEFGWLVQGAANETQVQLAANIYALQLQLLELQAKHSKKPEPAYMLCLAELRTKLGNIDWQSYFSILLGEQAPQSLPIELEDMGYMHDLAALLADTENHIVSSFILMRLCKYLLAASPRITARNCVEHMEVYMALGMDFLYDYKFYKFRTEDEVAIGYIFESLKHQFLQYLQQNKLQLSTKESEYLRQKLLKMSWRLGNLPEIKDLSYYNDYYNDANITAHSFFRNHWEMLRHRTQRQHEALLQQNFNISIFFVNDDIRQVRNAPYFVQQRNLLIVPLNFVQLPFYDHRLHPLLQHSLMGWILAHEINHGFEVDGIVLDADGNESTLGERIKHHAQFQASAQCMRRTRTASLIERMADINGFQLAYDAYFKSTAELFENLPFSQHLNVKRLFFLNFAQFFCGQLPPAIDHDRDDVRVMQILANMPEFAVAFECAHDAAENPLLKCQMWR